MPKNILTRGPSNPQRGKETRDGMTKLKDAIDSYWNKSQDEEGRTLYNRHLAAQAQLEHLETLKSLGKLGNDGQSSAAREQDFNQIRQQLQNEAATTRQTLEQRLGDDPDARSLLFHEVRYGGSGAYKTLAGELGVSNLPGDTPEWEGSYDKTARQAQDLLGHRLAAPGEEMRRNSIPSPATGPIDNASTLPVPSFAPSSASSAVVSDTVDHDLMQRALRAEMAQQFQDSRQALGTQLNTQADAQRLAFSQEMLPQLSGEAVMMGHFGSSRQGIAEGIARGRLEAQLASEQSAAIANLESGIASMQNQWGLEQMGATHQLALQDRASQQSLNEIGLRAQTDVAVARQKGLVDMDIARLQSGLNLDLARQQFQMNQESASQQGAMQQALAQQQTAQAWELEKWRREEELKEKQWSFDRQEEQQVRLKSLDSEQAMALEQFRANQSLQQATTLEKLRAEQALGQATTLEEIRGRQAQEQTRLQAEMDMKKTQMAGAIDLFGDMAKVGVLETKATPESQRAAIVRKELGLPQFQPATLATTKLNPYKKVVPSIEDATHNIQARLASVRRS
ncbi:MAG: hypothetical protein HQL76_08950 [Magnetococcales bacterium]|nr:hypothetical protein [Magnetococcales bacterium]